MIRLSTYSRRHTSTSLRFFRRIAIRSDSHWPWAEQKKMVLEDCESDLRLYRDPFDILSRSHPFLIESRNTPGLLYAWRKTSGNGQMKMSDVFAFTNIVNDRQIAVFFQLFVNLVTIQRQVHIILQCFFHNVFLQTSRFQKVVACWKRSRSDRRSRISVTSSSVGFDLMYTSSSSLLI